MGTLSDIRTRVIAAVKDTSGKLELLPDQGSVETAAVAAQGTITMAGVATAGETFKIGAQTFTWKALRAAAGQVTTGASASAACANIITAIGADIPATATAARGAGNTVIITATEPGASGNGIIFTEASTNMTIDGAGTLGGTTAGADTIGIAGRLDGSGNLVNPDDYDLMIQAAVERYSRHRPDRKVVDVTGTGGHDYPVPSAWVDEFSVLEGLEYPVGDVPATMLTEGDNEDYYLYLGPSGMVIRIITGTPTPAQVFRATFTIPRTIGTIAQNDVNAFCNLASSLCLEALANAFSQISDPTIAADVVNYRDKGASFTARAKRLWQTYKDHMGIKDDGAAPAVALTKSQASRYPGGAERLTHTRWAEERR